MAKDPAVLFYTSDFLSGTYTMTNEQVGKYIRLLCLQHQKGRLTELDMYYICKTYEVEIFSKFVQEDGLFFNQRMYDESQRRKKYSESRKKNISKRYTDKNESTYVVHMETETETINEIDIALKEGNAKNSRIPGKEQVKEYFENKSYPGWEQFFNHYDSQNWLSGNSVPIANWRSKAEVWNKNQGDRDNGRKPNQPGVTVFQRPTKGEHDPEKWKKIISEAYT